MLSFGSGGISKAAYAASDLVDITYYYQGKVLFFVTIPLGGTINSTMPYEMYSEEVTLEEGYILVWHIDSEEGEEWNKDFVFYQDTTLCGVAIEGQEEEELVIENPNDDTPNDGENESGSSTEEESNPIKEDEGGAPYIQPDETQEEYEIKIENVKGLYTITGEPKQGEIITVVFGEIEQGYLLSAITVISGKTQLVIYRKGNEVKFYMPEGDVTIYCYYKENEISETTNKLTKNEIIALSVVGGCALSYGIFLVIKRLIKQKSK